MVWIWKYASAMKNTRLIIILLMFFPAVMSAQTPVEEVIVKYSEVKGARNFIAKGGKLALARSLLDRTPVAPVSDDVEELAVLKMMNVSQESKESFLNDLTDALKSYDYYGRQETKNGTVDIYVLKKTEDTVEELVIYNAGIYSLNSLYGNFTAESLLKLRK